MAAEEDGARTTQTGEFVQRQLGADTIDLAAGQPGPSSLPLAQIAAAAAHRFGSPGANPLMLQYGPEQGYASFRAALAAFLTTHAGCEVEADELMVTAGVSHGIDLAFRLLAAPGDAVAVERPTYFLLQGLVEQNRLAALDVPTDGDALDIDALEALLQGGARPRLLYTVPVHSNPRGAVLPLERRRRLVRLAHQYGFDIIADEVYQMLSFPGAPPPPPPMREVERQLLDEGVISDRGAGDPDHAAGGGGGGGGDAGDLEDWSAAGVQPGARAGARGARRRLAASRVVSLGSWSKMLAPGMRLGWAEAAPATLERLRSCAVLRSGGCIAPLASAVAHSTLELGLLQSHLEGHVRPTLASRCGAMAEELDRQLVPLGCAYRRPYGGYFIWLELPQQVDSHQLLELASARHGVRFAPGALSGGAPNAARLCFAFYSPPELRAAVGRLAAALQELLGAAGKAPPA